MIQLSETEALINNFLWTSLPNNEASKF